PRPCRRCRTLRARSRPRTGISRHASGHRTRDQPRPALRSRVGQLTVTDPMWLCGVRALPPNQISFVGGVVALEPHHLTVALEREHVRGDTIEEPAIVADHHGAARELE